MKKLTTILGAVGIMALGGCSGDYLNNKQDSPNLPGFKEIYRVDVFEEYNIVAVGGADMNGDGYMDLIVGTDEGEIIIYSKDSTGYNSGNK